MNTEGRASDQDADGWCRWCGCGNDRLKYGHLPTCHRPADPWRPFGLTVEHALNRGDDPALLFDENSPIRGELRRLLREGSLPEGRASAGPSAEGIEPGAACGTRPEESSEREAPSVQVVEPAAGYTKTWADAVAGLSGEVQQPAVEPVAWVPVHPRNGPLWAMTTGDPNAERLPNSYPLKALCFASPTAQPAAATPVVPQDVMADARRWQHAKRCVRMDNFGGYAVHPDEPAGFNGIVAERFQREIDAELDRTEGPKT